VAGQAAGLKINIPGDMPTFRRIRLRRQVRGIFLNFSTNFFALDLNYIVMGRFFLDPQGCSKPVPFRAWLVRLRVFFFGSSAF
jgi:hypothetical protein